MNAMADNNSIDYDKVSRIYDTSRVANIETTKKLIKLLHIGRDSVILDMGSGTGNYAAVLQRVAKCVIGIDVSIGMIQQARAKFAGLQLICGDVTSLSFDSETFDGAFAVQVLHHIKKREPFLREAHRVLRKGACIAIHSCSHRQMQAFWHYHYFPKGLEVDLARIPDSQEIALLLESSGFSDIGIEVCYHDVVVADEAPERYLDKDYRDGASTFALLAEEDIERGCEKLREDIASGAIESIVRESDIRVANDVGGSCIVYGRKAGPLGRP